MLASPDTAPQRFSEAHRGVLAGANAVGEAGSLAAGEAQRLMLRIEPRTSLIEDARAQTFGGSAALATGAALAELVVGRTVDQAAAIGPRDIEALLGTLPPRGRRSPVLGRDALTAALAAWRGVPAPRPEPVHGALICRCRAVRAGAIEHAIRTHRLASLADVTRHTGAGGHCSCCREAIEDLLATVRAATAAPATPASDPTGPHPRRTTLVYAARNRQAAAAPIPIQPLPAIPRASSSAAGSVVREAISIARLIEQARPSIRADGGDVELVDYAESTVFVRLSGVCAGCSAASLTLGGLRQKLVQALGRPVRVVPVTPS